MKNVLRFYMERYEDTDDEGRTVFADGYEVFDRNHSGICCIAWAEDCNVAQRIVDFLNQEAANVRR